MHMAFEDKWTLLLPDTREKILGEAKRSSAANAARIYAEEVGMNAQYLGKKISRILGGNKPRVPREVNKSVPVKAPIDYAAKERERIKAKREAYSEVRLSSKEKKILKGIEDGTIDLETASRVVAAKAFEKLLKNPESTSFNSFIQAEMLKLKKAELEERNSMMNNLVSRMFGGYLPANKCRHCGKPIFDLEVEGGNNESVSYSGNH